MEEAVTSLAPDGLLAQATHSSGAGEEGRCHVCRSARAQVSDGEVHILGLHGAFNRCCRCADGFLLGNVEVVVVAAASATAGATAGCDAMAV